MQVRAVAANKAGRQWQCKTGRKCKKNQQDGELFTLQEGQVSADEPDRAGDNPLVPESE